MVSGSDAVRQLSWLRKTACSVMVTSQTPLADGLGREVDIAGLGLVLGLGLGCRIRISDHVGELQSSQVVF